MVLGLASNVASRFCAAGTAASAGARQEQEALREAWPPTKLSYSREELPFNTLLILICISLLMSVLKHRKYEKMSKTTGAISSLRVPGTQSGRGLLCVNGSPLSWRWSRCLLHHVSVTSPPRGFLSEPSWQVQLRPGANLANGTVSWTSCVSRGREWHPLWLAVSEMFLFFVCTRLSSQHVFFLDTACLLAPH